MQLAEHHDRFQRERIALVMISVDSVEDSRALADRLGTRIPLLSDPDMTVIGAWGVAMEGRDIAVPATFVVDRERRIRWRRVGETQIDRPAIAETLDQARKAR